MTGSPQTPPAARSAQLLRLFLAVGLALVALAIDLLVEDAACG
jgi:hypothetical protein